MGYLALIELALRLIPAIMSAIQALRNAEAEKRPLTADEQKTVNAVQAAAAAHDVAMGVPASAANAPHGPQFGDIS